MTVLTFHFYSNSYSMLSVQLYKHALTDARWNVSGEHTKLEELGSHKSSAETAVQYACASTPQIMNIF